MAEEGDFFADLLSGLKPTSNAPVVSEEDDVSGLVPLQPSMNDLRSAKEREENGDRVDVKRSNSPIGEGLAPPPPPLTKVEMETIVSNVLCEKLFETMGALTMALKTHLKQVDERIAAVDDKCEHLKRSMEELSQRHGESSNEIRKTLDSVTGSLRDTGMGLQRVLDKQELVDAHVLLSKLGKEASDAKKEANKAAKPDLITMKSKEVTDSGGPSEPNPPSLAPPGAIAAPKATAPQPAPQQQVPATAPAPAPALAPVQAPAPTLPPPAPLPVPPSPPQATAPPPVAAPVAPPAPAPIQNQPVHSHHPAPPPAAPLAAPPAAPPVPTPPPATGPPAPVPPPVTPPAQPHTPQVAYSQQPSSSDYPSPTYGVLPSQPPPALAVAPAMPHYQQPPPQPQPQQPPQQGYGQQMAPLPPPTPQMGMAPPAPVPQMPPPPHMGMSAPPPQPPQPPPPVPPQAPPYAPQRSQFVGNQMPMASQQMQFPNTQMPMGGGGGGVGYPQIDPGPQRTGIPAPPRGPPSPAPIYGAPPPMGKSSAGSPGNGSGANPRSVTQSMPLDQVIQDVVMMGFDRTKVRSVVTDMINQGKSVDMNVIIDRLTGGGY